jgi:type II secretory pathway predicted ATPase ExeA
MANVQDLLKEKAAKLIEAVKPKLGSYNAVAAKCQVSPAVINQVRNGTYDVEGNEMFHKIIAALEIFDEKWTVVSTTNMRKLFMVMNDARKKNWFMAVSEKAGSGKTTAIKSYISQDGSNASYFIKCRKWGNRAFLMALLRTLGINPESRYSSNDELLQQVIEFFEMRAGQDPILFIDQANSLKPGAFYNVIIHLFNEREGQMGLVAFGTENLQKEIKRGVKYAKDGADETDRRLGRKYITLPGSNYKDVTAICEANGIVGEDLIKEIWEECKPVKKNMENRILTVIEDHSRLRRIIERNLLKNQN